MLNQLASFFQSLLQEAEYIKRYKETLAKQYEALEEVTRARLEKKEKEVSVCVSGKEMKRCEDG